MRKLCPFSDSYGLYNKYFYHRKLYNCVYSNFISFVALYSRGALKSDISCTYKFHFELHFNSEHFLLNIGLPVHKRSYSKGSENRHPSVTQRKDMGSIVRGSGEKSLPRVVIKRAVRGQSSF